MRRLLGLISLLGCVLLLSACGDDDEPTPSVDSGPEPSDAEIDSGVDSGTDAAIEMDATVDAPIEVDAAGDAPIEVDAAVDAPIDVDAQPDAMNGDAAPECIVEVEVCDAIDNDCDEQIDEDLSCPNDCDPVCVLGADCIDETSCVCRAGYAGSGVEGCEPTLTALAVSTGSLSPALSADVTEYSLAVALTVETIELTPTVNAPATVTVSGQVVASGAAWTSPTLNLGLNEIEIVVAEVGHPSRSYTINVMRGGTQQAYIKASNTDSDDHFGISLALSGDTLVVGASYEASSATGVGANQADNQALYAGAVYVFVRDGDTWAQQAYLKASNAEYGDLFGASVALDGDLLVVGAPREASSAPGVDGDQTSNTATNAGAAYVFVRDGETWTQSAYLKASNAGYQHEFGSSVSVSGETLAVGSRFEGGTGAAYVFVRSDQGVWSQQAYLKAQSPGGGDQLGASLALSGDTLVVGAPSEDSNATGIGGDQTNNSATNSGAVYLFTRDGTTWTQHAYVKASNAGAGDGFGGSVAISGDTFVVGAISEASSATGIDGDQSSNSATNSGAAYVFTRGDTMWMQSAYLKASNTGAGDLFGSSVAIAGNTVVVGAHYESSNARRVDGEQSNNDRVNSGAAYVFMQRDGVWTQSAYLKATNADASDWFGRTVATTPDTFVVGAYQEASNATGINGDSGDNMATSSGAVYVFR